MSKLQDFNSEKLFKQYNRIVKDFTEQELEDALCVLVADPEFLTKNLGKYYDENLFNEQINKFLTLFTFETERYKSARELIKQFDVLQVYELDKKFQNFIGDSAEYVSDYPKIPILADLLQRRLRKLRIGEELSPEMKIKDIEIFYEAGNEYSLTINKNYDTVISVSKISRVWQQFYTLCEDRFITDPVEGQYIYDYFNFRPENRIYKKSGYPPQQLILKKENGKLYEPNFKTEIHSTKTLVRRQNAT